MLVFDVFLVLPMNDKDILKFKTGIMPISFKM